MAAPARAQPVATSVDPQQRSEDDGRIIELPVEEPISAEDVRDAPRPGAESGRLDEVDPGDSTARKVGRRLMWVPRLPIEIGFQPVRGVLYLHDRYRIFSRIEDLFTSVDKRIAIYPTVLFETGFGANFGVRARFNDVFGNGERLRLRAGFGGAWQTIAELDLDTGQRFWHRLAAGTELRFEERDEDRFYGYGNADVSVPPLMPIDPTIDDRAVKTIYKVKTGQIVPRIRYKLLRRVAVTASAAFLWDLPAAPNEDMGDNPKYPPIDQFYNTDDIPGFVRRRSIFSELAIAWDTRRPANDLDPPSMRGTGGLAFAFGGRHDGLGESADYYRVGFDLQRYIPLTTGPRVIELRAYGEMVTGDIDEVSFLELPRLGGEKLLRGYDRGRFRDRVAAVAQAGYLFALSRNVAASLFVDAGRVYSGLDDLTLSGLRVGFGTALELYSERSLVIRAAVATSIDGTFFGYVAFDPAFDAQARTERR